ncbi:MAG: hypothetical protein V1874_10970 [Spirochaetota bacterium]
MSVIDSGNHLSADEARILLESINLSDIPKTLSKINPFSHNDITAGCENELQVMVKGLSDNIDLPQKILSSDFYHNVLTRLKRGDVSGRTVSGVENYIRSNTEEIWENSWVHFPYETLGENARKMFEHDLLRNKKNPETGFRSDMNDFLFRSGGEMMVRIPVSYLLKLSLADILENEMIDEDVRREGTKLLPYFTNDNSSPEVISFYVASLTPENGMGESLAREMIQRFLLVQILIVYAADKFRLKESGQEVSVYFSPLPPVRQRILNSSISDNFYRELFMSPCLSGWDNGEEKKQYMHVCHEVLSRSSLNILKKLDEAGLVEGNLVFLPHTSNVCLANNGTHISIGSRKITDLVKNNDSEFNRIHEKYVGDLVIKIFEHFIPLFIGNYSASPYRIDFRDFRPEIALGFLPHELDYSHIRMVWRLWKEKADLAFFGNRITPFGPAPLDRFLSILFRLKGDFVHDFRIIDYFMALMSTDSSPSLNGLLDNDYRLCRDLERMGVYDSRMSPYYFCKLRQYGKAGFSGFEGRYYSAFNKVHNDMTNAVNLQVLVTSLAFKYIKNNIYTHRDIPDDPVTESERRHIIFSKAIDLPSFYLSRKSPNKFLAKIAGKTKKTKPALRYKEMLKIEMKEYQKALLNTIEEDGADIIHELGMEDTIRNLREKVMNPESSVAYEISKNVFKELREPYFTGVRAEKFNLGIEKYYRENQRKNQIRDGLESFYHDLNRFNDNKSISNLLKNSKTETVFTNFRDIDSLSGRVFSQTISSRDSAAFAGLLIAVISENSRRNCN